MPVIPEDLLKKALLQRHVVLAPYARSNDKLKSYISSKLSTLESQSDEFSDHIITVGDLMNKKPDVRNFMNLSLKIDLRDLVHLMNECNQENYYNFLLAKYYCLASLCRNNLSKKTFSELRFVNGKLSSIFGNSFFAAGVIYCIFYASLIESNDKKRIYSSYTNALNSLLPDDFKSNLMNYKRILKSYFKQDQILVSALEKLYDGVTLEVFLGDTSESDDFDFTFFKSGFDWYKYIIESICAENQWHSPFNNK